MSFGCVTWFLVSQCAASGQVGYVFAWTNVFVRSLWVLTAVCLAFWICGARPQMGGYEGTLCGAHDYINSALEN